MDEHYAITYKGLAVLLEARLGKHPELATTIATLREMPYPEAKASPFVKRSVQMILDSFENADRFDQEGALREALERAQSSDAGLSKRSKKGARPGDQ